MFMDIMNHIPNYFMGLSVNMRIENPSGHRIQQIIFGNEPLVKEKRVLKIKLSFLYLFMILPTFYIHQYYNLLLHQSL